MGMENQQPLDQVVSGSQHGQQIQNVQVKLDLLERVLLNFQNQQEQQTKMMLMLADKIGCKFEGLVQNDGAEHPHVDEAMPQLVLGPRGPLVQPGEPASKSKKR